MTRAQTTTSPHAVEAKALTKKFDHFTAVDGVSFTIDRGEIFGFLGPNGAGKTTTIRMLLGLIPPTSGTAVILGQDVLRERDVVRQRLGYMSQRFSLYNDLTISENLDFFGGTYGVRGERLRRQKKMVLEMAGLQGRERELTKHLSGGWRQRLALGCALLHEPDLLFLDEPTAGVDPISRRQFWDLLYLLSGEGHTIFVTTHYMDEAEHCHRLAFIQRGRLTALDTPRAIKAERMRGQVLEVECSAPEKGIQVLGATIQCDDITLYGNQIHLVGLEISRQEDRIKEALQAAGIALLRMELIPPSLEEVFIASIREQDAIWPQSAEG